MIAYFDTSALIPLLVEERTSDSSERLWYAADRVMSVRLVYPEARAALAMARRLGRMSASGIASAKRELRLLIEQLDQVELTEELSLRAGDISETHALRCYDAVHLAAAERVSDSEMVFVSSDVQQREAARGLGLSIADLQA